MTYTYGSYGAITKQKGTSANPLLFAGQYRDAESGLYYLQARYYDPSTGQFMSVDPALAVTGIRYGYAESDPVNFVDPLGLASSPQATSSCQSNPTSWWCNKQVQQACRAAQTVAGWIDPFVREINSWQ